MKCSVWIILSKVQLQRYFTFHTQIISIKRPFEQLYKYIKFAPLSIVVSVLLSDRTNNSNSTCYSVAM